MNLTNIIVAICSLLFLSIGADKFFGFLEPPCSVMGDFSPAIWKLLGVLQIAGGLLIWMPKLRKYVVGFFLLFMLFFTAYHLIAQTYDIGGAVFMAVLLGLLLWNPSFLHPNKKVNT